MIGQHDSDEVEFEDCRIVTSTEKAALIRFNVSDRSQQMERWIPWSQVRHGSIEYDNQYGTVILSRWIAEKKDLL